MTGRRSCAAGVVAVAVLHSVLSVVSEMYGGIVGLPVAVCLVKLSRIRAGSRAQAEYHMARVIDSIPLALVIEGVLIVVVGLLVCRARNSKRSNSVR